MRQAAKSLMVIKDDDDWLKILLRSVNEPIINGVHMPRFPFHETQASWVGSHDQHALNEAKNFYLCVKGYAAALGNPIREDSNILDFGCGWGRFPRFFWQDVPEDHIYGVDVDRDILAVCRGLGVPGQFSTISPLGQLPFEDNFFDIIIAYSVFSHLPERVALHWMRELSRVSRGGCIFLFTAEPRRFLTFIAAIPEPPETSWHAALVKFKRQVPALLEQFDKGRFCYLPTSGGGEVMTADVYGDAIVPE
jgi:hypothetical protein